MNKFYFMGIFLDRGTAQETTRSKIIDNLDWGERAEWAYCNLQMYFMLQQVILSHRFSQDFLFNKKWWGRGKENHKKNLHFYDGSDRRAVVRLWINNYPFLDHISEARGRKIISQISVMTVKDHLNLWNSHSCALQAVVRYFDIWFDIIKIKRII